MHIHSILIDIRASIEISRPTSGRSDTDLTQPGRNPATKLERKSQTWKYDSWKSDFRLGIVTPHADTGAVAVFIAGNGQRAIGAVDSTLNVSWESPCSPPTKFSYGLAWKAPI